MGVARGAEQSPPPTCDHFRWSMGVLISRETLSINLESQLDADLNTLKNT